MNRRIVWILCLGMLAALLLPGCGAEQDAPVGTWRGSVDLTQPLNDEVTAAIGEELESFFCFHSFVLPCKACFTEEGTYTISFDRSGVEQALPSLRQDLRDGMYAYVACLIRQEELDMDVDAFLALSGESVEEMTAQIFEAMDLDGTIRELLEFCSQEGTFSVRDGALMLSDSPESDPDAGICHAFVLQDNTLTIAAADGHASGIGETVYPLQLTRAA